MADYSDDEEQKVLHLVCIYINIVIANSSFNG